MKTAGANAQEQAEHPALPRKEWSKPALDIVELGSAAYGRHPHVPDRIQNAHYST
jgi:hypothetical protein